MDQRSLSLPHNLQKGNFVFARRSVKSDAEKGFVAKLMEAFTGPWEVVESLDGG